MNKNKKLEEKKYNEFVSNEEKINPNKVYPLFEDLNEMFQKNNNTLSQLYEKISNEEDVSSFLEIILNKQDDVKNIYLFFTKLNDLKMNYDNEYIQQMYEILYSKILYFERILGQFFGKLEVEKLKNLLKDKRYYIYKQVIRDIIIYYNFDDKRCNIIENLVKTKDNFKLVSKLKNFKPNLFNNKIFIKELKNQVGIQVQLSRLFGFLNPKKEEKYYNFCFFKKFLDAKMNLKIINKSNYEKTEFKYSTFKMCKTQLYEIFGNEYLNCFRQLIDESLVFYSNDKYSFLINNGKYSRVFINKNNFHTIDGILKIANIMGLYSEEYFNDDIFPLSYSKDIYLSSMNSIVNQLLICNKIRNDITMSDEIKLSINILLENEIKKRVIHSVIYSLYEAEVYNLFIDNKLSMKNLEITWNNINKNITDYNYLEAVTSISNFDFVYIKNIYSALYAIQVFNKIKKDYKYSIKYIDYLKKSNSLSFEEKIEFLGLVAPDSDVLYNDYNDLLLFLENEIQKNKFINFSIR